ncbi:hypothetical protein LO762_12630 [Actinocorallia sp. API 0066]|uniref:hypothetical protein n=1 Tax=Actinocorallia sp. API 0066 TaxID=2896846 RepID=UPI001E3091C9|nr:hypothetical protein [Actinocorallia sp. API 0066]MCD0450031.1 hypothetical protein [Actinocorallia sp. API 0066]
MNWQTSGGAPADDPFATAEADVRAMTSSAWWQTAALRQRAEQVVSRLLAGPGEWWLFGAWGRWYRCGLDGHWHPSPPPADPAARRVLAPAPPGVGNPPVPPQLIPTGPDIAAGLMANAGLLGEGPSAELVARVQQTLVTAIAVDPHQFAMQDPAFQPGTPTTVAALWGAVLFSAGTPVVLADHPLVAMFAPYLTVPAEHLRWMIAPDITRLAVYYTDRLGAGDPVGAAFVVRMMGELAGALAADRAFQPGASALASICATTLQYVQADQQAMAYGPQTVAKEWLRRCPAEYAAPIMREASPGEFLRLALYDLALVYGDISEGPARPPAELRRSAAAVFAADLQTIPQAVPAVLPWLDPESARTVQEVLGQAGHPLRELFPQGVRLPPSLSSTDPGKVRALLALTHTLAMTACRLSQTVPQHMEFVVPAACAAELGTPALSRPRATSATAWEIINNARRHLADERGSTATNTPAPQADSPQPAPGSWGSHSPADAAQPGGAPGDAQPGADAAQPGAGPWGAAQPDAAGAAWGGAQPGADAAQPGAGGWGSRPSGGPDATPGADVAQPGGAWGGAQPGVDVAQPGAGGWGGQPGDAGQGADAAQPGGPWGGAQPASGDAGWGAAQPGIPADAGAPGGWGAGQAGAGQPYGAPPPSPAPGFEDDPFSTRPGTSSGEVRPDPFGRDVPEAGPSTPPPYDPSARPVSYGGPGAPAPTAYDPSAPYGSPQPGAYDAYGQPQPPPFDAYAQPLPSGPAAQHGIPPAGPSGQTYTPDAPRPPADATAPYLPTFATHLPPADSFSPAPSTPPAGAAPGVQGEPFGSAPGGPSAGAQGESFGSGSSASGGSGGAPGGGTVVEAYGIKFLSGVDDIDRMLTEVRRRGKWAQQLRGQEVSSASAPAVLLVGAPSTGQRRLARMIARALAEVGFSGERVRTVHVEQVREAGPDGLDALLAAHSGETVLIEGLDELVLDDGQGASYARALYRVRAEGVTTTTIVASVHPDRFEEFAAAHPELVTDFRTVRLPDLEDGEARLNLLALLAAERFVTVADESWPIIRQELAPLKGRGRLVNARLVETYLDRSCTRHLGTADDTLAVLNNNGFTLTPTDVQGIATEIPT